jgi:hypothetical protein
MNDLTLKTTILDSTKIQGYERNGLQLPTQAIPEYTRLFANGIADGQTAVFVVNFDFIPDTLSAKYTGTTGSITISVKRDTQIVWAQVYQANDVSDGVSLPAIPIEQTGIEIHVTCSKAVDFLWISIRQCHVLSTIPATRIF